MGVTLEKTKICINPIFEEARNALRELGLSEDLILMKIAGYRNYNSLEENLLYFSPEWTSNPLTLSGYLDGFYIKDGWIREAIEIGL